MDQNKNAQGTQKPDKASQQNRVHRPSESGAEQEGGNRGGNSDNQERGTGSQGEKNSSGISNRGMSESEEQADLPSRGSSGRDFGDEDSRDQSRQSER